MKGNQADVLIIGGGLMGAAAAFFLRQRKRSVVLVERGLIGQQASGVNYGNIRRQGRFLPQIPLANRALGTWTRIAELTGEDAEFRRTGQIRICYDPARLEGLESYAVEASRYGLELDILGQQALRSRFPYLTSEAIAGSYSPEDGQANPRLAAPGFGRAAARAGASIFENTEIVSVLKAGEDFEATAADGKIFRAPVMLITAGAWGGLLSAQFGEPVPLVAHGPQMAVTEPLPQRIRPSIGVYTDIPEEGVYLRQVERGNIVFGGGPRGPAFLDIQRAHAIPRFLQSQVAQLRRLVPALAHAHVIRSWSGIEGYLPDDIPIMGQSARVPGLFHAFGFCGHGFQLGPGVGDVMAELIDKGATSTPIEPFHIRRFLAGSESASVA